MALHQISEPQYKIDRPAFGDTVFTASSSDYLAWPAAVAFAREQNSVLQSAREVAAFRIEAKGHDSADEYQTTRTVVAYFHDGNAWHAAVDDIADPEQNIVLARAQEGYDAHSKQNTWSLPKTDAHVRGLLERAGKTGRIYAVNDHSPLKLVTLQIDGKSAFGQDAGIQTILGDTSEDYAAFLTERKRNAGYLYHLTPKTLETLDPSKEKAEIRLVGLGGVDDYDLNDVNAYNRCDYYGRARGVRSVPAKRDAP